MKSYKRHYLPLITLSLLLPLCCGCLTRPPVQEETLYRSRETCRLALAGDVQRVIQGTVRAQDMESVVTERLLFALGGATPERMEEIGECILIAGQGYTKSNNPDRNYEVVASARLLKTPFLMGIGSQARPAEIIYLEGDQGMEEIYQGLSARFDFFAVAGIGEFQGLATTALKKAPIYGEEIIAPGNRTRYFHPVTTTTHARGIFFGIVLSSSAAGANKGRSQRMFYTNFANTPSAPSLQSHTHIAIVDDLEVEEEMGKRQEILSVMATAQVKDVRHLLTQSRLRRALIMVFDIYGE